jgi:hypothetical protein
VVHLPADQGLALKTLEESDIALRLGMRDFDRELAASAQIRGTEDRSHPAARHEGVEAVVIQAVSRLKWRQGNNSLTYGERSAMRKS